MGADDPLRAVVLGYGFIGAMHVEAAASVTDVEVVGVSGHRLDAATEFARRWGIDRVTDDWASLCAEPDVDLVIIGTPNSLHAEQAIHALDHGKHVLVEKPMATTVADADRMIAAAQRAERTLAVGHMWRYHPDVIALRDRVAAGEFGRIVRTHGWGVHAGWGPSGWFTDPALAGGGALIDMGIHAIDTARFLLGDPEPTRVGASIGVGEFGDYDVDDDGDRDDRLGRRCAIDGGVRVVAAPPRWTRGRHQGAGDPGHRPHLDDAAAATRRVRPLRRADVRHPARRRGAGMPHRRRTDRFGRGRPHRPVDRRAGLP